MGRLLQVEKTTEPIRENKIHNLLTAIIERAVLDTKLPFRPYRINGEEPIQCRNDRKDARDWLLSNNTREWSFIWVARQLKLTNQLIKRIRLEVPTGIIGKPA